MRNNEEILNMFENYLAQIQLPEEPQLLYQPILYAMSGGGKRIRPTLLLLCCEAFGGDVREALSAASAVEMFHNFTLLHDDIMDNALVRRGKPSVFAEWGENVAILSGDAMMIYAYKLLYNVPEHKLPRIISIFTEMALQVCEGQQYDMDFETQPKVAVAEYMNMIEQKTAALLAGSVVIGATIAGASADDIQKLNRFATEVGIAFQLQDDLLDSYGDEQLGKKIGGDILEGKKTYLMIISLSHATEPQREVLRKTYLRTDIDDEQKIAAVKEVYDAIGARAMTEQQITVRISRALAILDTLDVPKHRTEHMRAYVESLVGRKK